MPRQKTPKKLTDKQKIRLLEREIRDMQRDFRETFSVLEEKPKKKSVGTLPVIAVIGLAAMILLAAFVCINVIL
ncbi:MAG: hypothetical protein J6C96_07770 [Oscillospiraceae bacterium]|nr:hypothetical protein [Oscillospiraceae bacterium]